MDIDVQASEEATKEVIRKAIKVRVEDLVCELLWEGRKDDEELDRDAIADAFKREVVTPDEVVEWFGEELDARLG